MIPITQVCVPSDHVNLKTGLKEVTSISCQFDLRRSQSVKTLCAQLLLLVKSFRAFLWFVLNILHSKLLAKCKSIYSREQSSSSMPPKRRVLFKHGESCDRCTVRSACLKPVCDDGCGDSRLILMQRSMTNHGLDDLAPPAQNNAKTCSCPCSKKTTGGLSVSCQT